MTRQKNTAFTVIELLVVVSIIALLIGILVPSLRRSREMARTVQCLSNIRAVHLANVFYVQQEGRFPALNNDADDGAWQYNYLIYDGRDYENNFGPLIAPGAKFVEYEEQFYCPLQKDPFHTKGNPQNPWPVTLLSDTRAAYGRRYHLTGKSLSQIPRTIAFAADVFHLPKLIKSAHKRGVNAVYTDGHAGWVKDPGILTDNELAHPFDVFDNPIIEDIWDVLDRAG